MKDDQVSDKGRLILEKLDHLDKKLGHLLRLHVSLLSDSKPSDEDRKRIDKLRGFSADLYNFTRIARGREEIKKLVKQKFPEQKNIDQYVHEYTSGLKERGLIMEVSLGDLEYIVRCFGYDAPSDEEKKASRQED